MKKITFEVSPKKEGNMISLIKEINKISCRILIDIKNELVIVENADDAIIDTVIELINNYCTILFVDIYNMAERDVTKETIKSSTPEITKNDAITEKEVASKTIEPQSKDDLIIKVESRYIEQLVNKLLKTVSWAIFKMNISEKEIGEFIWTSINEISMKYTKKDNISFSVGDVVACNYGIHLAGEVNGGYVSSIVCNISNTGMAYVVPIIKNQENLTSDSYLTFTVPDGIVYDTLNYTGGTVLLDKGKYVRPERFQEVVGKTTPEFLTKVLNKLATTFDFTTVNMEKVGILDTPDVASIKKIAGKNTSTQKSASQEDSKTAEIKVKTKSDYKKVTDYEIALMETVGAAFYKLDSSKKVEEQIDSFLTNIEMTTTEKIVTQSFVVACKIKKITYDNVILELQNIFPKVNEKIIEITLRNNFKKWLESHPEVAIKCPRITFMSMLKLFAKKFA